MKWPGKEPVEMTGKTFTLPPEGRYNVALINTRTRKTASGTWLVFIEEIDTGEHKGTQIEEEFYFKDAGNSEASYARLQCICTACDWWPPLEDGEEVEVDAFSKLWPLDDLRWSVECVREYSIKAFTDSESRKDYSRITPEQTDETMHGPFWLTVDKAQYDQWPDTLRWAKLKPAFTWDQLEMQVLYQPADAEAETVKEEAFVPDDEMPF